MLQELDAVPDGMVHFKAGGQDHVFDLYAAIEFSDEALLRHQKAAEEAEAAGKGQTTFKHPHLREFGDWLKTQVPNLPPLNLFQIDYLLHQTQGLYHKAKKKLRELIDETPTSQSSTDSAQAA